MSIKALHEHLEQFLFVCFFLHVFSDAHVWATPGDFAGTRRHGIYSVSHVLGPGGVFWYNVMSYGHTSQLGCVVR